MGRDLRDPFQRMAVLGLIFYGQTSVMVPNAGLLPQPPGTVQAGSTQ